jgi:iron complex outermembrane receptor protein
MQRQTRLSVLALSTALSVAAPVFAQTLSNQPEELSEIIVTARRKEERLQDVPVSVQVFNQQQVNDRNIVTLTDLATFTPSLSAGTVYGPDSTSFAVRGFSGGGQTPSVGVCFADAIVPRGVDGNGVAGGRGAGAKCRSLRPFIPAPLNVDVDRRSAVRCRGVFVSLE